MEKNESVAIGTPYDDVFRTMITDSDSLAISLINLMFGLNISKDAKLVRYQNEVYLKENKKRITDSQIGMQGSDVYYHMECESTAGDENILFKLYEYDSAIAHDHALIEDNVLKVTFPKTGILYLRDSSSTPDVLKMEIKAPDSTESLVLNIPTVKISKYSIDEIFEKELWFLLPFFIFNYEKRLKRSDATIENEILEELVFIKKQLENSNARGKIDTYSRILIEQMTEKVTKALAIKHEKITKGVDDIMGGKVLEYEAKTILNKGIEQGRSEGFSDGRNEERQLLEAAVIGLKSGKSADDLIKAGIDAETVDLALKCVG